MPTIHLRSLLPAVLWLGLAALPGCRTARTAPDPDGHDVVVYGGTAAGVVCAIRLAQGGHRVLLVEPTDRIGGMTTCGLGATDVGNQAVVGGLAREFYRRLRRWYDDDAHWSQQARDSFKGRGQEAHSDAAWTFEPHVALAVLRGMLAETDVDLVMHTRVDLRGGAITQEGRITALRTTDGRLFRARLFVDASYEGDLMAQAGVRFRVGREANAEYGEQLNGVQVARAQKHQFEKDVDPYRIPGDPSSGLLPLMSADPLGEDGSADHRVQAYCLRLCTTDLPENRLPWPKPAGYRESDYEILLRNFEAGDHRVPWHRVAMPNRKTDTNNNFAISTDALGMSWAWPEADWERRESLFAEHLTYTQGLCWTLANHPRVPKAVRDEFQTFGLCRDEFLETGGWPPQLYVREARRMVAAVVVSERHCRGELHADDPVGMGSYGMDSHNVQRYVDAKGHLRNEGDIQVHGFAPYGIPYRAIVPRREECTNLLVPVCVSATHIAYGSIRMEPVFMVLGHSAAVAADLALAADGVVQDVDYAVLAERLRAEGQVLSIDAKSAR